MNPAKDITRSKESRDAIKRGIDEVANTVKTTLGPKGRNAMIQRGFGAPHVTKDGVTVARSIYLQNPAENMGAQLVKEVAGRTASDAGDGTTTATVLAQNIIELGLNALDAGHDAQGLRRGIERAVDEVVNKVKASSIEAEEDMIKSIASISANDDALGAEIAKTIKKVGKNGVVSIQLGSGLETTFETTTGYRWDGGFVDANFATDRTKGEAIQDNVHILITDQEINSVQLFMPVIEKIMKAGIKKVAIVAPDVRSDALATLVVNHVRNVFSSIAIKAPGFGNNRLEMLEDLAVITGAQLISDKYGRGWENFEVEWLGTADQVKATKDYAFIAGGKGSEGAMTERMNTIKELIDNAANDHEKSQLQDRMAGFDGGAAVIKVGAASEVAAKEERDRIEDAVASAKAALEHGIVAGGGIALLNAGSELTKEDEDEWDGFNKDERAGYQIVLNALRTPFLQIARNAGANADEIYKKVMEAEGNYGFNAKSNKFEEDMIEAGVVDPCKVTTSAILNAASIAVMVITTESTITDAEQEEPMAV